MPAEDTVHFALKPGSRRSFEEDLRAVYIRGQIDGIDFMARPGGLRGRKRPAAKFSVSRLVQVAVAYGGAACRAAVLPVAPALPATTSTADAARLKAARGTMTRAECARAAGLKDESSVRNVESRGMKLAGKLLAWVESVEAGR